MVHNGWSLAKSISFCLSVSSVSVVFEIACQPDSILGCDNKYPISYRGFWSFCFLCYLYCLIESKSGWNRTLVTGNMNAFQIDLDEFCRQEIRLFLTNDLKRIMNFLMNSIRFLDGCGLNILTGNYFSFCKQNRNIFLLWIWISVFSLFLFFFC